MSPDAQGMYDLKKKKKRRNFSEKSHSSPKGSRISRRVRDSQREVRKQFPRCPSMLRMFYINERKKGRNFSKKISKRIGRRYVLSGEGGIPEGKERKSFPGVPRCLKCAGLVGRKKREKFLEKISLNE